jgi:hypothetical protein
MRLQRLLFSPPRIIGNIKSIPAHQFVRHTSRGVLVSRFLSIFVHVPMFVARGPLGPVPTCGFQSSRANKLSFKRCWLNSKSARSKPQK